MKSSSVWCCRRDARREIAVELARFSRGQQDFVLRWVKVVAASNARAGVSICSARGELLPEQVAATRAARIAREKNALRIALAKVISADAQRPVVKPMESNNPVHAFRVLRNAPEAVDNFTFELQLDGQSMIPLDDVQSLMASIIQDLGQVPEDYLVAAGDGPYDAAHETAPRYPRAVWKGTDHKEGAHLYNELDWQQQQYRKNWAVLREFDGHP